MFRQQGLIFLYRLSNWPGRGHVRREVPRTLLSPTTDRWVCPERHQMLFWHWKRHRWTSVMKSQSLLIYLSHPAPVQIISRWHKYLLNNNKVGILWFPHSRELIFPWNRGRDPGAIFTNYLSLNHFQARENRARRAETAVSETLTCSMFICQWRFY